MAPTLLKRIGGAVAQAFDIRDVGPLKAHGLLTPRSDENDPGKGGFDPHDINNVGFFFLFALIGVAFVVTGIWFFFWAKNGGFHFHNKDWDDYKTTVLRRKGPNGTLLSGATATTDLGGGSVYKEYKDVGDEDHTTVVSEGTALTGVTAGPSEPDKRESRRRRQEKRDQERRKERHSRRHVGEEGVEDDMAEKSARSELRNYRHERPARVGGLNKESEGSAWDGSTNQTQSEISASVTSELLSNRQETPTNSPKKPSAGIRKVHSVTTASHNERSPERDTERLRAEARRLREEGRSARRDFSYQRAGAAESTLSESLLESSSQAGTGSDLGTKSYHHPMPELREQRRMEREERRARRGGYRRGRTEDDDDI